MANADSRSQSDANSAGHTPLVSDEHAEGIRRWHDNAYEAAKAAAGHAGQTFTYLGRTLVVPPEVQPITGMSHLLGEAVLAEAHEGDRVLDMGTGSGVNAILAATKAADVLAVDINPTPLRLLGTTPRATVSPTGSRSGTATSSATSTGNST